MIIENMNKFQELRNTKKDIFNVKIKFWYLIKYYLKNFFLNTILKTDFRASNITILILTKEELHKINDVLSSYSYVLEHWIYNWEGWYTLDNKYSLYLFYKNSLTDFELNKDFYLHFFQQVKYVFSSKHLVWEKQILLKIFWYHSLLTCFKMIFNSIHFIWLFHHLGYEKNVWIHDKLFNNPNILLRQFIDMNEENFENEMKMFYDVCYWFDITKLYYSLFFNVNLDFIRLYYSWFVNIDLLQNLWKNLKKTWTSYNKDYIFKDKWLEFFYLSMYLYFDKIQKFDENNWKQFRELCDEEKLSDFYCICQVLDEQVKLGRRDMNF